MSEQEKHQLPGKTSDPEKLRLVAQLRDDVKALASSKAGDLRAICTIDPSEPLMRIVPALKQPSRFVTLALANKVHSAVLNVATKPKLGKGATIKLAENAVQSVRIVLTATIRALASTTGAGESRSGKQLEAFAKRCTNTMTQCCELSERSTAWKDVLEYTRDATSIASLPLESFLSEQNLGPIYQRIEQGMVEAMNLAMSEGDTASLADFSEILRRHRALRAKAHQHVASLISERASTLPTESQAWALRELGLSAPETALEYSDPADGPEIRQAASLLMFMFDEQTRNVEFKEALDRFRGLCEAHFHLFLRGAVGSVTEFDSRLHEPCDDASAQVRLVRPWVEWYRPPNARIVIRGIVESLNREAEAQ